MSFYDTKIYIVNMAEKKINAKISLKSDGTGKVTADVQRVTNSVRKSSSAVDALNKKLKAITISSTISAIHHSIGMIGNAFGAAKGVIESFSNVASKMDATAKFSRSIGMSVPQLQRWQHAASLSGLSTEEFSNSMRMMSINVSKAMNGEKKQLGLFNALGISLKKKNGVSKKNNELLLELADAYNKVTNAQDRMRISMELFGDTKMINLLEGGRAAINKAMEEADALGYVFSEEDAANAEEFDDNIEKIGKILDGIKNKFVADLFPEINKGLKQFTDWWIKNKDTMLKDVDTIAAKVSTKIGEAIDLVKQWNSLINTVNQENFKIEGKDVKFAAKETAKEVLQEAAESEVATNTAKFSNPLVWGLKAGANLLDHIFGNDTTIEGREEKIKQDYFNITPYQENDPAATDSVQTYTKNTNVTKTSNLNINIKGLNKDSSVEPDPGFDFGSIDFSTGYAF